MTFIIFLVIACYAFSSAVSAASKTVQQSMFQRLQTHVASLTAHATHLDFNFTLMQFFYDETYRSIRPLISQLVATMDENNTLDVDTQADLTIAVKQHIDFAVTVSSTMRDLLPSLARRGGITLHSPVKLHADTGLGQVVSLLECLNQDKCYRSVNERQEALNETCVSLAEEIADAHNKGLACDEIHLAKADDNAEPSNDCTWPTPEASRDMVVAGLLSPAVSLLLPVCWLLKLGNPQASDHLVQGIRLACSWCLNSAGIQKPVSFASAALPVAGPGVPGRNFTSTIDAIALPCGMFRNLFESVPPFLALLGQATKTSKDFPVTVKHHPTMFSKDLGDLLKKALRGSGEALNETRAQLFQIEANLSSAVPHAEYISAQMFPNANGSVDGVRLDAARKSVKTIASRISAAAEKAKEKHLICTGAYTMHFCSTHDTNYAPIDNLQQLNKSMIQQIAGVKANIDGLQAEVKRQAEHIADWTPLAQRARERFEEAREATGLHSGTIYWKEYMDKEDKAFGVWSKLSADIEVTEDRLAANKAKIISEQANFNNLEMQLEGIARMMGHLLIFQQRLEDFFGLVRTQLPNTLQLVQASLDKPQLERQEAVRTTEAAMALKHVCRIISRIAVSRRFRSHAALGEILHGVEAVAGGNDVDERSELLAALVARAAKASYELQLAAAHAYEDSVGYVRDDWEKMKLNRTD